MLVVLHRDNCPLSILAFGARFFDPDVGLAKMLTLQQLLLQIDADRWQDVALSAGNIFFCFTLVPMLRHPDKAAPSDMHTDGASPPCWRIRVCDPAFMAHSVDPDDNGPSVARSGFQKISSNRPSFAERFSSNMKLNSRRTSAQDVVLGSCKE